MMAEIVRKGKTYVGEGTLESPYVGLVGYLVDISLNDIAAEHLGEVENGGQIFIDINGWKFQVEKASDTKNLPGYVKVGLVELGLSKGERPSLESAQDAVHYAHRIYSSFLSELLRQRLSL